MKYVEVIDGHFCCVLSENGIQTTRLGCSHEKPRQASAHTVPIFVPALRHPAEPIAMPPDPGTAGDGRLSEATTASTRTRQVPPSVGSGALA